MDIKHTIMVKIKGRIKARSSFCQIGIQDKIFLQENPNWISLLIDPADAGAE